MIFNENNEIYKDGILHPYISFDNKKLKYLTVCKIHYFEHYIAFVLIVDTLSIYLLKTKTKNKNKKQKTKNKKQKTKNKKTI